jgi:hypothetical protein
MKIITKLITLTIGVAAVGIGCACHRPPPSLLMQALDANHAA